MYEALLGSSHFLSTDAFQELSYLPVFGLCCCCVSSYPTSYTSCCSGHVSPQYVGFELAAVSSRPVRTLHKKQALFLSHWLCCTMNHLSTNQQPVLAVLGHTLTCHDNVTTICWPWWGFRVTVIALLWPVKQGCHIGVTPRRVLHPRVGRVQVLQGGKQGLLEVILLDTRQSLVMSTHSSSNPLATWPVTPSN